MVCLDGVSQVAPASLGEAEKNRKSLEAGKLPNQVLWTTNVILAALCGCLISELPVDLSPHEHLVRDVVELGGDVPHRRVEQVPGDGCGSLGAFQTPFGWDLDQPDLTGKVAMP